MLTIIKWETLSPPEKISNTIDIALPQIENYYMNLVNLVNLNISMFVALAEKKNKKNTGDFYVNQNHGF